MSRRTLKTSVGAEHPAYPLSGYVTPGGLMMLVRNIVNEAGAFDPSRWAPGDAAALEKLAAMIRGGYGPGKGG